MARLGDIARLDRRSVQPEEIDADASYVGLENIETGGAVVGLRTVKAGELKSAKFAFDTRHILYGKLRPNLAKIARPDFSGVCSTDIVPILPGQTVDKDFLAHFLLAPSTVSWASSRTAGVNLPRLSPSVLETLEIPLPPLPEQRRIASILDDVSRARDRRARTIDALTELVDVRFSDLFGWSRELTSVKLAQIASIKSGSTPDRSRPENFGGGIPWVKTGEVRAELILKTEETVSELGKKSARLQLFPAGSIIVAMYGQGKTRGQSAVLGVDAAVNQACAVILPNPNFSTKFMAHQIRRSYEALRNKAQGGNQANLNLGLVGDLDVLLPPMDEQKSFADFASAVDRSLGVHRAHLAKLDELFASLQHRAFRGEL